MLSLPSTSPFDSASAHAILTFQPTQKVYKTLLFLLYTARKVASGSKKSSNSRIEDADKGGIIEYIRSTQLFGRWSWVQVCLQGVCLL